MTVFACIRATTYSFGRDFLWHIELNFMNILNLKY